MVPVGASILVLDRMTSVDSTPLAVCQCHAAVRRPQRRPPRFSGCHRSPRPGQPVGRVSLPPRA